MFLPEMNEDQLKEIDLRIIRNIIEFFESIKKRPQMYYEDADPRLVENGMFWFHMAFIRPGYKYQPVGNEIVKRNLHKNTMGLARQLKERGLSDKEVVNEIIEIEIANWKNLLKEIREDV